MLVNQMKDLQIFHQLT